MRREALPAIALLAFLCASSICRAQSQRIDSAVCATCHPGVWQTYRRTGMARSFYRPRVENTVEDYKTRNTYYHKPSDTYFGMIERDGKFYQRQYQVGFDGKQTNALETGIDFVLGSGDHARTYLHRAAQNTLVELPLGWYAEKGGYWAMNPGYDRPDHEGIRRRVTYDCMFCHNSYPEIPAENAKPRSLPVFSSVPEGIDCQRCHGDGARHVALAQSGHARPEELRSAIVNPSRLTPERQMEVCLQCHLETTSSPLPGYMIRYERGPFSYRPGEALSNFVLHFDEAPNKGYDDKFEIGGSAYRLRKSACFRESKGAMTCTTCHNPHDALRGEDAAKHYTAVCRQCHAAPLDRLVAAGKHTTSTDCVGCHMPKRRTDDVVHVAMTDHYIQRQKPARDLLAEKPETIGAPYRGKVVLYYPDSLPKPQDELYLAIAQVTQNSNLSEGLTGLSAAIEKYRPAPAEYYLQLGDGLANARRFEDALPVYEEALRREPDSVAALGRLALALPPLKQYARAEETFKRAVTLQPGSASLWVELGLLELQEGKSSDAVSAFEKAIQIDPDMVEAYISLGAIRFESGDVARGEAALRSAICIQPNSPQAHNNLGNLLSETGHFEEAQYHFQAALGLKENYIGANYNYALALTRVHRLDDAQAQIDAILRVDPASAEAHEFLGSLLAAKGQTPLAIEQFREAVRLAPGFSRANLDLGKVLASSGDVTGALPYLRKAAGSDEAATRDEARGLLQQLAKPNH